MTRDFESRVLEKETALALLQTKADAAEAALQKAEERLLGIDKELSVCQGALQAGLRDRDWTPLPPSSGI